MQYLIIALTQLFSFSAIVFIAPKTFSKDKPKQAFYERRTEWTAKVTHLNQLENEIFLHKKKMQDKIKTQKKSADPTEKKAAFDELVDMQLKLHQLVTEYNKLRANLRFRFPDKGDVAERRYMPMRKQSIDEIEDESSLDIMLTRLNTKIKQKYSFMLSESISENMEAYVKIQKKKKAESQKRSRFKLEK